MELTKCLCIDRTELGMITAAPLGNIMEEACYINKFLFGQGLHDLAGKWHLGVEALQSKAPQVADHEQCVLIDCVGMEQVVLHAPHNASERGNVAAQDAVAVHAAELVRDPDGFAQNGHEKLLIHGIRTETLVDEVPRFQKQTDSGCTYALEMRVLLQEVENLEERGRVFLEHAVVRHLNESFHFLEARIDGCRVIGVITKQDGFLE